MALQGRDEQVKLVGLFGATSIGKTTSTYMLTGRLRTHGINAVPVTDSARDMSFPPTYFDENPSCYAHVIGRKIAAETGAAMRPGVECIISDRTPMDWVVYYQVKHPKDWMLASFNDLARAWLYHYDALYYFPIEGTELFDDSFREPNDSLRVRIDNEMQKLCAEMREAEMPVKVASGSYRERMEMVYHDIMGSLYGQTRGDHIRVQVTKWVAQHFKGISEVRVFGSHSVTRMHAASDHDDYDVMVVLNKTATALDVKLVYEMLQKDRGVLEPMCQATLDLMVCTEETMPYET